MPLRGQLTVYLKDLRKVRRRTVYHSTGFPPNFRFHSGERSRSR